MLYFTTHQAFLKLDHLPRIYWWFRSLRHLGASVLNNANVNIGVIQRILGHENRKTTEIYLHSVGEAEREAMRIFEEVSKNSHTDSHTDKKEGG